MWVGAPHQGVADATRVGEVDIRVPSAMIGRMGRFMTPVQMAEERLAGIARALQSAYDEELREATQARDAARLAIARADAMESAARSLGRDELATRLGEVIDQLRASETVANARVSELNALEKSVQAQLVGPTSASALPPAPAGSAPTPAEPTTSLRAGGTPAQQPAAAPKPVKPEDDLGAREKQLLARVDELERLASKWSKDIAKLALQEHVALGRLLMQRLTKAGLSDGAISAAIGRMKDLAAKVGAGELVGADAATSADWNRVASDARAQRVALVESKKKAAAAAAT